jgi:restriction system protein
MSVPARTSPFIGRKREREELARQLLPFRDAAVTSGVVVVRGGVGVGKSSFVTEFVNHEAQAFPAGVTYTFATSSPPPSRIAVLEQVEHLEVLLTGQGGTAQTDYCLVVVDEAHRMGVTTLELLVKELRKRRPRARFIFVSPIPLSRHWSEIVLEPLPHSDVAALLAEYPALKDLDVLHLASHMQGNPQLASLVAKMARAGEDVTSLITLLQPTTYSGLLGPDGRPLESEAEPSTPVRAQFSALNSDLVSRIETRPELIHDLSPRQFEEFVADLYRKHGFAVELTPTSRDGGVDLYAVRYEAFGSYLTVVDCKQFASHRPVEVRLVRELYGVVQDKGASAGVLATTSSFTAGAREFQERHKYRLALQDWFDLQDMLRGPLSP